MPFDPESAVLVAPDAPVAPATGKFQPDSAQPVADTPKEADDNYAAQWAHADSWIDRLAVIGKYFQHPMARYEQSVEQSFDRPAVLKEIPRAETDKDTNIVGQAAAAPLNALTGTVNAMQTAGGASMAFNPAALVYATPYFAAKTWEAAKKGFGDFANAATGKPGEDGKPVTTGQLSEDVVNTAMGALATTAGGLHGIKGTAEMVRGTRGTPEEAAPATNTTAEPPVLTKFDAASAAPVDETQPVEAPAAESAPAPTPAGEAAPAPAVEQPAPAAEPVAKPTEANFKFDAESAVPVEEKPTFDSESAKPVEEDKTQTNFDFSEPAVTPAPADADSTYGIAARVTDVRASGNQIEAVEPGVGISAQESVARGRDLLASGKDPQAALEEFQKTGQISGDLIALVRAHGETLAKAASDAAEESGIDSPEYKQAAQADSDWVKAIKPIQTESHRAFMAQQGETDLDTGNFHALARSYSADTGKEFTQDQASRAKEIADAVKKAVDEATEAQKNAVAEVAKKVPPAKPRSSRIVQALSERADAARARIIARLAEGRVSAGLDPLELKDYAEVGAYHIAKGIEDFASWGKKMVDEFGEKVRPHLEDIFREAKRTETEANPEEGATVAGIWKRAKDYIDAGETSFDDIRHKIATDLGIPVEEVTKKLTEPKSVRTVTDEMYAKLSKRREVIAGAKDWLRNEKQSKLARTVRKIPSAFFAAKVFGHGTVGMITHAGVNAFDPAAWKSYFPNFARQFKLLGWHDSGAFHERMMDNLQRDRNFITAKRAGLANDPYIRTDDYQNTRLTGWFKRIGLTGTRGFDALKLFRQARFNQIWDTMPDSMKTPDNAKMVADSVNHATGVVRAKFPEWTNWTFFAPKLEGSRWAFLLADPARAAKTFASWENSTPAEKAFAMRELKQKATMAGVYLSLLAVNQGMLSAAKSPQKINFTDPSKSDFLSFKADGYNVGVVGPMLGVVRLLANVLHAAAGKRTGAELRESRMSQMSDIGSKYLRGKASPAASFAIDNLTQADFQGRPLPYSNDKVPAYLRREGVGKYTYPEYAATQLPIPVAEAVKEVWKKQGMDESTAEHWLKALTMAGVMGGTGARMSEDNNVKPKR